MINKMREMAPVIMLVILVAFVGGTIFMNWGMNLADRGHRMMTAGKINGREIPLSYFDQKVNDERQRLQEGNKDIPPQQYRMVPQQVWEQEVNKSLMQQISNKLRLGATGEEVFSYIKNNPLPGIDTVSAFQTDGKFDTSKYVQFLNDPNNYQQYRWLQELENYTASNIIPMQKMEALLNAGAVPSPAEIAYANAMKTAKAVYEYAKVSSTAFPVDSSAVSEEMVKTYYTAHRDSFKVKEQADIYYVKFPKVTTAFDENVYRQDLLELKSRIENAEKPLAEAFAEEATIESDDPGSAQRGGELGWFKRGMMVKEFDSVAFSLPVGTISDPVKTAFGLHLIYVEAREMRDSTEQVRARHILRKISPTMETLDLLAEKADSLRVQMLDKGFVVAAKEDSAVTLDSTGLFEKGDAIPGIGYLNGAGTFLFKKSDQQISERLENNDAIYLITLKRKLPAGYLSIADATAKIRKILSDSLQMVSAKAYLEKVKTGCSDSLTVATCHARDSVVISGVTDTVSGNEFVTGIGYSSPVTALAMVTPVGEISPVIEDDGACYIVKPLWKKDADPLPASAADPKVVEIADQLKQRTQQRIYMDWYYNYKNHSKIKSNVDEIYVE